MPFLSVIIPLYNKESYIKNTLRSVLEQNFTDFEIIIVNDGSKDNSLEIVSSFKDERIQVIHQPNSGASSSRNKAIQSAKTEYIAFLDADDFWFPNHLEELVQLIQDFPNCGMYCSRYQTIISKNHTLNNSFSYSFPDSFRGTIPDFFQASLVNRVATSSSIIVPKKIILENNGFNTAITSGQDLELWTKIALNNTIAINNSISAIYHFEAPNSLAKTTIKKKKLMDFTQFAAAELQNKSLKKFLDVHRLEYALHYKIVGLPEKSNFYLNDIATKIPFKTKLLLVTPSFILRFLLTLKQQLKKIGIDFTVYH